MSSLISDLDGSEQLWMEKYGTPGTVGDGKRTEINFEESVKMLRLTGEKILPHYR